MAEKYILKKFCNVLRKHDFVRPSWSKLLRDVCER